MAESRAFAGTLSSGQRYLVCNSGNRQFLVLAVGKPGTATLVKSRMIRKGRVPALLALALEKAPVVVPRATEHDGKLIIVYAAAKEDCEMAIVPVASLAAIGP